ncbi:MAG: three-Cys-motif partner protein TcmP [Thermoanaerobaculaceae bacterium]
MTKALPQLVDDGLLTPLVGEWGEEKYRLVRWYAAMFAKATRRKWHVRVYLDLFAGTGRARLEGSARIVPGTPLLALEATPPFDRCIFCERDKSRLDVLERRVRAAFPNRDAVYILGDANSSVETTLAALPVGSRSRRVLGFCVLDPFGMSGLHFSTVEALAVRYLDFLVLVPSGMDAARFWGKYESPDDDTVADFLGLADWRERWADPVTRCHGLGHFVLQQFAEQMATLRFSRGPEKLVRAVDNKRPLYHLAFFSRNPLGLKLARGAVEYTQEQRSFGFEESEE